MKSDEGGLKQISWIEQCDRVLSILREGDKTIQEIIGPPQDAQNEFKKAEEPSNVAARLDDMLGDILIEAQHLIDQIGRILQKF